MTAERTVQAFVLLIMGSISMAQDSTVPNVSALRSATNISVSISPSNRHVLPMTNETTAVISRLRGVEPAHVKITPLGQGDKGRFEIDLAQAKDPDREAHQLSKALGTLAVVMYDQASHDGQFRTNRAYRNGLLRQVSAPMGTLQMQPGTRRLYVWPEPQGKESLPARLRIEQ